MRQQRVVIVVLGVVSLALLITLGVLSLKPESVKMPVEPVRPVERPVIPAPATVMVEFERTVWALPVGVDIRYPPEIGNEAPVRIFSQLPTRFYPEWEEKVTIAEVVTQSGLKYRAIPVRLETIKWFLVLNEEHLVELERLGEPITSITVHPK